MMRHELNLYFSFVPSFLHHPLSGRLQKILLKYFHKTFDELYRQLWSKVQKSETGCNDDCTACLSKCSKLLPNVSLLLSLTVDHSLSGHMDIYIYIYTHIYIHTHTYNQHALSFHTIIIIIIIIIIRNNCFFREIFMNIVNEDQPVCTSMTPKLPAWRQC